MPKRRVMIQLDDSTLEQVDKVRGAVPRAAWVRLLIEKELKLLHSTDSALDSRDTMSLHQEKG